jgi:5'-3' exoribonuclease 1
MGIPSYFSYIVKNHPEIIRKFQKGNIKIHNLYLDCNSIIYDVFQKIDYKTLTDSISLSIIKQVCFKIVEYINLVKPSNSIFIAFDGVAPVAKLDQQRNRRYKSSYQNNILRNIYKKEADPWNTAEITPGTKFMNDLSLYINNFFKDPSTYNVKTIINSASNIYGEGEHKIFEYIRDNKVEHKNQNTVIYGLDADLIMLSINHLPICPNIFLFRETPHFIQSIDRSLEPNENYLLDIPLLTTEIINKMNSNEMNENIREIKIYDYIFLSFFLGNDFLPHFPAINIRTGGIDKMLNAYKATLGHSKELLTDGKKIYWKNVRLLVQYLASQEEEYIKQEYKLRNKREKFHYPTDTPEEVFKKFESLPTYEREIEKYINPFRPYWEQRYYKSLFHIQSDSTNMGETD